jgi:hypothetical protein
MGNAVSGSRGRERVALAQQLAAHRQLQQPEAEPSGPLKVADVMLVLNWGDWGNGPNLLLCSLAASRSARCSNDTAALSRSVGSQDRIVARVRRGGYIRPGLAFFQPRCHSCHCCGQRCGQCRGNHQIVPLFCTRAALGSASVFHEAGKWCAVGQRRAGQGSTGAGDYSWSGFFRDGMREGAVVHLINRLLHRSGKMLVARPARACQAIFFQVGGEPVT